MYPELHIVQNLLSLSLNVTFQEYISMGSLWLDVLNFRMAIQALLGKILGISER